MLFSAVRTQLCRQAFSNLVRSCLHLLGMGVLLEYSRPHSLTHW